MVPFHSVKKKYLRNWTHSTKCTKQNTFVCNFRLSKIPSQLAELNLEILQPYSSGQAWDYRFAWDDRVRHTDSQKNKIVTTPDAKSSDIPRCELFLPKRGYMNYQINKRIARIHTPLQAMLVLSFFFNASKMLTHGKNTGVV